MNKNNCKVGQKVAYFPRSEVPTNKAEFGVVTELREKWAMVLYTGDTISKSTLYSDLEAIPDKLVTVGENDNGRYM